jgi:hypothetical protein
MGITKSYKVMKQQLTFGCKNPFGFCEKLDYSPPDGFYGSGAVGGTCQREKVD